MCKPDGRCEEDDGGERTEPDHDALRCRHAADSTRGG
jgi:hypothetical protein